MNTYILPCLLKINIQDESKLGMELLVAPLQVKFDATICTPAVHFFCMLGIDPASLLSPVHERLIS
jgi:hypothetical protein